MIKLEDLVDNLSKSGFGRVECSRSGIGESESLIQLGDPRVR